MKVADFDFALPADLIAQTPPTERGSSRLLTVERHGHTIRHGMFSSLPSLLRPGDLLVLNDSRVFPARLLGHRTSTGGAVECLLLERAWSVSAPGGDVGPAEPVSEVWTCLMRAGGRLRVGTALTFERDGDRLDAEIVGDEARGQRLLRLRTDSGTVLDGIERIGHVPLPPYIDRPDVTADRERYQTVYARQPGSVAAPTAGLHFTDDMLGSLLSAGVEIIHVTLHVGYGTFKPVRVDEVEAHVVDPERYEVSSTAAAALTGALQSGRRVIAVGSTTTRVLESLDVDQTGTVAPARGETKTFIYPGHQFRVVKGLITNFHLPRSSLLMLVAALGGRELVMRAYEEAVAERYRFYSYGDAMFIT